MVAQAFDYDLSLGEAAEDRAVQKLAAELGVAALAIAVFILKQGADGVPVAEICRKGGIIQATYFNWKKLNDGLLPTEMRRLKLLEAAKLLLDK